MIYSITESDYAALYAYLGRLIEDGPCGIVTKLERLHWGGGDISVVCTIEISFAEEMAISITPMLDFFKMTITHEGTSDTEQYETFDHLYEDLMEITSVAAGF